VGEEILPGLKDKESNSKELEKRDLSFACQRIGKQVKISNRRLKLSSLRDQLTSYCKEFLSGRGILQISTGSTAREDERRSSTMSQVGGSVVSIQKRIFYIENVAGTAVKR